MNVLILFNHKLNFLKSPQKILFHLLMKLRRNRKDLNKFLKQNKVNVSINVDLLKIFRRKSFEQNLHKIFSSKKSLGYLKKFSEDLPKNEIS